MIKKNIIVENSLNNFILLFFINDDNTKLLQIIKNMNKVLEKKFVK